ncbi:alkene reductase [Phenylobacterium sp.]|uniref:alkene reductase n=1 Tax=Phenylobacterium sp. TaxID=1871053 RepID=UPI0035B13457
MRLFDPFDLAGMALPNRIVMAPMTRSRAASEVADDLTANYYRQRATAGLIITEGVPISPEAVGYAFLPGFRSQTQRAGWRKVATAVRGARGRIFMQLWHVGRVSHASLQPEGRAPVSSTDRIAEGPRTFAYGRRDDGSIGFVAPSPPRALTTEEVSRVVAEYARAARDAVAAGFDGVEIHGAHGYLIEQFLNPLINDRTDQYGGSDEGRRRFLFEVVDAVALAIGPHKVGIRLSPRAQLLGAPAYEGNEAAYLEIFGQLAIRDIAYIHLSDTGARSGAPVMTDDFLRRIRAAYKGTLILAGSLDAEKANRLVEAGLIDLAAFGQPFIANPDLVDRIRRGAPWATPDASTYYGGGAAGYTDYPTLGARANVEPAIAGTSDTA